jgi:ankyrin repeat protein
MTRFKNMRKPSLAALAKAVVCNDEKAVLELLRRGVDVNEKDDMGWTALRQASVRGYTDMARLLLDNGADVNQKGRSGATALMDASWRGHVVTARLLIGRGADVNAVNDYGTPALNQAVHDGHVEVVRLLIEHGADSADDLTSEFNRADIEKLLKDAPVHRSRFVTSQKQRSLRKRAPKPVIIRGARP